jgi:hypothetical protein
VPAQCSLRLVSQESGCSTGAPCGSQNASSSASVHGGADDDVPPPPSPSPPPWERTYAVTQASHTCCVPWSPTHRHGLGQSGPDMCSYTCMSTAAELTKVSFARRYQDTAALRRDRCGRRRGRAAEGQLLPVCAFLLGLSNQAVHARLTLGAVKHVPSEVAAELIEGRLTRVCVRCCGAQGHEAQQLQRPWRRLHRLRGVGRITARCGRTRRCTALDCTPFPGDWVGW